MTARIAAALLAAAGLLTAAAIVTAALGEAVERGRADVGGADERMRGARA